MARCMHLRECAHESQPGAGAWGSERSVERLPCPEAPAGSRFIAGCRNSNQPALPAEFSSQPN